MNSVAEGQRGASELVVPLALVSLCLLLALGFGGWAFAQMLDYKNHTDAKVVQAVAVAKQDEDKVKDAAFAEAEKQPLREYDGPSAYGSVKVLYPKTWSAYVSDKDTNSPYVDGYFYPSFVPDIQASSSVFALRVSVVQNSYSAEMSRFSTYVQQGQAKVAPYKLPKVPSVVGSRVDGQLPNGKSGSMIILPMRNMTLEVWTEAPQFMNDFEQNILPNLSFLP